MYLNVFQNLSNFTGSDLNSVFLLTGSIGVNMGLAFKNNITVQYQSQDNSPLAT